jgi:8-oxo-dGTP pyrophosphatase MutT (NUDIX family)
MPIISNGIIAYRKHFETKAIEYLMICRKDSLGLMDFIRGKYSVNNKYYIMNMISQMTMEERMMLLNDSFEDIWKCVWDLPNANVLIAPVPDRYTSNTTTSNQYTSDRCTSDRCTSDRCTSDRCTSDRCTNDQRYKSEEYISREKFNQLRKGIYLNDHSQSHFSLASMIAECNQSWEEPEWGFPKGRRNYNENDIDCALREFYEETGFQNKKMSAIVMNLAPYEEIFMGSNYKSYKHRYFLMYIDYELSLNEKMANIDKTEVSKVEWKSFNECLSIIRPYNLEKKRILSNINIVLTNCTNALV